MPISNESRVLYVAAKAPRPGLAKTRLGVGLGETQALSLYKAFLRDIAENLPSGSYELGWFVTPADAWLDLGPLVAMSPAAPRVVAQPSGNWTDRQRWLFQTMGDRGETFTVLIASDSPQVTAGIVEEAFETLDHHDVVLGPTIDGGYFLIGMRGWFDVLRSIPMSTNTVLRNILANAKLQGVSLALLHPTFDVDCAEDLDALAEALRAGASLPHTRAALASLALESSIGVRP
ncbi:MAG: DUF2064 domain-containing protein [Chloroflexota bacterium]